MACLTLLATACLTILATACPTYLGDCGQVIHEEGAVAPPPGDGLGTAKVDVDSVAVGGGDAAGSGHRLGVPAAHLMGADN